MPPLSVSSTGSSEASDEVEVFDPASGFIRFEADVSAIASGGIFSPEIEVLGIPWKLRLVKESTNSASDCLAVYLFHRNSDSNMWSIDVDNEMTLKNGNGEDLFRESVKTYTHEAISWGCTNFLSWDDLIATDKGYMRADEIIIEARFTLSNIVGLRTLTLTDFTNPNDSTHDVTLMIEGEKIYVSKAVLAVHSPVFKTMFFSDFAEKNKKEIELKDVDRKEFVEMLNLIYPSYQKITDTNAEFLLNLADRYQVQAVINQVVQFLIESSKFHVSKKLMLSDQYRLLKLQEHCLGRFREVEDVMNLKTSSDFKTLSDKAKIMLLLKAMSLS